MKNVMKLAAAIAVLSVVSTGAFAEDVIKGTVKKVDMDKGRVTVIHDEIPNLGMPAMTMVFEAGDETMTGKLKEGQEIEFTADRVKGRLTITSIKE